MGYINSRFIPSRDIEGNYVLNVRDDYRVIFWYNRRTRDWVVQKMDPQDNQIGDSVYIYSKREALNAATIFVNHLCWLPPSRS